ncbi:hypothetical protein HK097_005536, partial [Rhizophlyctis rosea]
YSLALGLNALYLFIKFYRNGIWTHDDFIDFGKGHRRVELEDVFEDEGIFSTFDRLAQSIEWLLIGLSIVNTIHMFNRSKDFMLFWQPTRPRDEDNSDNSWKINSPNAKIVPVDLYEGEEHGSDDEDEMEEKRASGRSCWFSPQQVAIIHGLNSDNWQYSLPLAFIVGLMTYMIVTAFQDLLHDREILQEQLLKEYSEGFVYTTSPFRDRRDQGTQTTTASVGTTPARATPARGTPSQQKGKSSTWTPYSSHSYASHVYGDKLKDEEEEDECE